jgi:hypothetical protein
MTAEEIDRQYTRWTALLHRWIADHTGKALSVQYYPAPDWKMHLFRGDPEFSVSRAGIPALIKPPGYSDFALPQPGASQEELDHAFRLLCLAAARQLDLDLKKLRLPNGNKPR